MNTLKNSYKGNNLQEQHIKVSFMIWIKRWQIKSPFQGVSHKHFKTLSKISSFSMTFMNVIKKRFLLFRRYYHFWKQILIFDASSPQRKTFLKNFDDLRASGHWGLKVTKGFRVLRAHFIIIVWELEIHKLVLDSVIIHLEGESLGRGFIWLNLNRLWSLSGCPIWINQSINQSDARTQPFGPNFRCLSICLLFDYILH